MNTWNLRQEILTATHRWCWIVASFLLGALLVWVVSYIYPAPYRATQVLYVGLNAYRANSWFGEMDCSVALTGGKVETLEFSFLIDENGEIEEYFITANDIDLDLDKPNSTINILESFIRKMPG